MAFRSAFAVSVLAAAYGSGCTFTHRCHVPDPVVEAAPGPAPIPLAIQVRYTAPADGTELSRQKDPHHVWIVDAAPPSRALFDRLAASMFERTVPAVPREGDARIDASLEIRLDRIAFDWQPIGFGPYSAAVAYRVALRDADGAEVAALAAAGSAEIPTPWTLSTHCEGIGRAVAIAMQDAGAGFLGKFASDPAVATWFAARELPLPVLTVRPAGDFPRERPPPPTSEMGAAVSAGESPAGAAAPAAPRASAAPVSAGVAMAPRTFQLRVGLGVFVPDETAGKLEDGRDGFSLTVLSAEYRFARALGLELEFGTTARSYSGRTLPPSGGFAVPSGIFLGTTFFGAGLRAIAAGGPVEPWVGATAHLMRTELSSDYTLFGLPGSGEPSGTAWSVGLDLGAGLSFYPGGRHVIGIEVRRLFSQASFDPFQGDVSIGGFAASLTYGAALP